MRGLGIFFLNDWISKPATRLKQGTPEKGITCRLSLGYLYSDYLSFFPYNISYIFKIKQQTKNNFRACKVFHTIAYSDRI